MAAGATAKSSIVDDEVGIRELLSEILQDEGYRVALAENASEARAYRQRQQPALVLLDIWMPDTDGVTLLREWGVDGAADDAGRHDVGPRHDRDRRRGDARSARSTSSKSRSACRSCSTTIARALQDALRSKEPRRISLAALGTSAPIRDAERALESLIAARRPVLILGEAGHRTRSRGARAADAGCAVRRARQRRAPRRTIRWRCSRRRATACSTAPRSASTRKRRAEGPRVPAAEARQAQHRARRDERGAARQPRRRRARFDAALLSQLSSGAVVLPPLRAASRRHSGADRALLARGRRGRARSAAARIAVARRADGAVERVLARQPRSSAERRREHAASCAARSRPISSSGCSAKSASPNQVLAPEITDAVLRAAAARGARGVRAHLLRAAARAASRAT